MDISEDQFNKENQPKETNKQPTDIMQKLMSSNLYRNEEQTSSEEDEVVDNEIGFKGRINPNKINQ
jgi:hypothetical protein